MGAVLYAFDSVPSADEDRRGPPSVLNTNQSSWTSVMYEPTFAALSAGGFPVPEKPAGEITRDELVAHLQATLGGAIKAIVEKDADGLYAGKTSQEIADAFCSHRVKPGSIYQRFDVRGRQLMAAIEPDELVKVLMGPNGPAWNVYLTADKVDLSPDGGPWAAVVEAFPSGSTREAINELVAPKSGQAIEVESDLQRLRFPHAPNLLTAEDIAAALGS